MLDHPMLWMSGGELEKTSISPGGRWEVRMYFRDSMNSGAYLAEVRDREHVKKTRNIYHEVGVDYGEIKWRDSNTVVIRGHKIDVRTDEYP